MKAKISKPKPINKVIFSAQDIIQYIKSKYNLIDKDFWIDIFSECSWGDHTLLSLDIYDINCNMWGGKFDKYLDVLRKEFIKNTDDELYLAIENDL